MSVGDGTTPIVPNTDEGVMELPDAIVSRSPNLTEFIAEIYPNVHLHFGDSSFFEGRAILTPRNDNVDLINRVMLKDLHNEGESRAQLAETVSMFDSACVM